MVGDVVVARSDQTVVVEGNHCSPLGSVTEGVLRPSRSKSLCPWKGVASYYTVVTDGGGATGIPHSSPAGLRTGLHSTRRSRSARPNDRCRAGAAVGGTDPLGAPADAGGTATAVGPSFGGRRALQGLAGSEGRMATT